MKKPSILFGVILMIFSSTCMAGPPYETIQKSYEVLKKPIKLFKVDIGLTSIGAATCPCSQEIERSGAMYFKDIMALVDPGSGSGPIGVTVTAKYYDLIQGRLVTRSKHVNLRYRDYVTIASGYFLIKKSPGLTIEVKPDAPFLDKNPSNNKVRITKCQTCYIVE